MVGFGLGVQGDHGKRISRVYLYRPKDSTGARSSGCRLCNTQLIIGMDLDGEAHGFFFSSIDLLDHIHRCDRQDSKYVGKANV